MKIYLASERQRVVVTKPQTEYGADYVQLNEHMWLPLWLQGARVKRRLFSYFYHNERGEPSTEINASAQLGLDLFLDSGAFTAFSKGVEIDVKEYAAFVRKTRDLWTCCSSLDAIGSGEESARGSRENFLRLRDLGADVCPVFHVREPDEYLCQYIEEGWPYIFIGGMVPETTRWLKARLDGLWSRVLSNTDGTPRVKTHGFGLTDQLLMFRYPWYSVDSTSWLMTGVFGSCVFPPAPGARGVRRLEKVSMSSESKDRRRVNGRHYDNLSPEEKALVDKWLERAGVTAEQCAQHYSFRDAVNAATFQAMEEFGAQTFQPEQETLFE